MSNIYSPKVQIQYFNDLYKFLADNRGLYENGVSIYPNVDLKDRGMYLTGLELSIMSFFASQPSY